MSGVDWVFVLVDVFVDCLVVMYVCYLVVVIG